MFANINECISLNCISPTSSGSTRTASAFRGWLTVICSWAYLENNFRFNTRKQFSLVKLSNRWRYIDVGYEYWRLYIGEKFDMLVTDFTIDTIISKRYQHNEFCHYFTWYLHWTWIGSVFPWKLNDSKVNRSSPFGPRSRISKVSSRIHPSLINFHCGKSGSYSGFPYFNYNTFSTFLLARNDHGSGPTNGKPSLLEPYFQ